LYKLKKALKHHHADPEGHEYENLLDLSGRFAALVVAAASEGGWMYAYPHKTGLEPTK
jgi:hypothetical protein